LGRDPVNALTRELEALCEERGVRQGKERKRREQSLKRRFDNLDNLLAQVQEACAGFEASTLVGKSGQRELNLLWILALVEKYASSPDAVLSNPERDLEDVRRGVSGLRRTIATASTSPYLDSSILSQRGAPRKWERDLFARGVVTALRRFGVPRNLDVSILRETMDEAGFDLPDDLTGLVKKARVSRK
jgi:hypothetical protein